MSRSLSSIPYHAPDLARLTRSLNRAKQATADSVNTPDVLEHLRGLEDNLSVLQGALRLAELRSQENHAQQRFFLSEIERLRPYESEMESVRRELYAPLLHSPDLSSIARVTGPLFLYRRQNDELFGDRDIPVTYVHAADSKQRTQQDGIVVDVPTTPSLRSSGPAIPLEVFFDEAVTERSEYASELGFETFNEAAWLLRERFDYGLTDMEHLRIQILAKLVPISASYRSYWSEPPRTLLFGEDDTKYYHSSPVYRARGTVTELSQYYADAWPELSLPDLVFDVTRELQGETDLQMTRLQGGRTYVLSGNLGAGREDIYQLWCSMAEVMLTQALSKASWIKENHIPTAAVRQAICQSVATLMTLDDSAVAIWGEEAASCLPRQTAANLLVELIGTVMLDDYESRLYNHPYYSISERRDLWTQVYNQYWPGELTEADHRAIPWRYGTTLQEFINHAAGSRHDRLIGILTAFQCMDLELQKQESGKQACRKLIEDAGRLPFRSLQGISGLPPIFEADSLKRLAYQIAYILGL